MKKNKNKFISVIILALVVVCSIGSYAIYKSSATENGAYTPVSQCTSSNPSISGGQGTLTTTCSSAIWLNQQQNNVPTMTISVLKTDLVNGVYVKAKLTDANNVETYSNAYLLKS